MLKQRGTGYHEMLEYGSTHRDRKLVSFSFLTAEGVRAAVPYRMEGLADFAYQDRMNRQNDPNLSEDRIVVVSVLFDTFVNMNFSSKLLEQAVEAFSSLPGVGKKSALRFALFLIDQPQEQAEQFGKAIVEFRQKLKKCATCGHLSDQHECEICMDQKRDKSTICVVESIRDVLAIESTNHFFGVYHVLGGIISPIDGIAPGDLTIEQLVHRVQNTDVREVIMAIRPTIEGDTTSYYIAKKMEEMEQCKFSIISRGVSFGGELEFTDEVTLGRSITGRLPYNPNVMISS
jgi:recombination protein RecR